MRAFKLKPLIEFKNLLKKTFHLYNMATQDDFLFPVTQRRGTLQTAILLSPAPHKFQLNWPAILWVHYSRYTLVITQYPYTQYGQ